MKEAPLADLGSAPRRPPVGGCKAAAGDVLVFRGRRWYAAREDETLEDVASLTGGDALQLACVDAHLVAETPAAWDEAAARDCAGVAGARRVGDFAVARSRTSLNNNASATSTQPVNRAGPKPDAPFHSL